MSARNTQSDTSRVVVKNPLLSAVAGSIDDFVNNSILLPAAEIPVAVLPPVQSHETENRGNHINTKHMAVIGLLSIDTQCNFSKISPNLI